LVISGGVSVFFVVSAKEGINLADHQFIIQCVIRWGIVLGGTAQVVSQANFRTFDMNQFKCAGMQFQ
jgi:hypothetical protein